MSDSSQTIVSLARAFALSDTLPMAHALVEEALERVATAWDRHPPARFAVSREGFQGDDGPVADPVGEVERLAASLFGAGVRALELNGPPDREGLAAALEALRSGSEEEIRERLQVLADDPAARARSGMARSIAALYPLVVPEPEPEPDPEDEDEFSAELESVGEIEPEPEFEPDSEFDPPSEPPVLIEPFEDELDAILRGEPEDPFAVEPEVVQPPEFDPEEIEPLEVHAQEAESQEVEVQEVEVQEVEVQEPELQDPDTQGSEPEEEPAAPMGSGPSASVLAPLYEAAMAVVDAPAAHRPLLIGRMKTKAELLMGGGQVPAAADVVDLARGVALLAGADISEGKEPLSELAQGMATPEVCAQIASWIGTAQTPEEREMFVEAAAILPDPLAISLVGLLKQDSLSRTGRRAATRALILFGPRGREHVELLLEDPRWFVVRNGLTVLAGWRDPETVPLLVPVLAHEDGRVRREAVVSLGRIGGEGVHAHVLPMLEDPDPLVRAATARALGSLGQAASFHRLISRLEDESERDVEIEIIKSLGQLGDPGAVPLIEKRAVSTLFNRPTRELRLAAYHALASIGTPHALTLLEAAELDRDPEVRRTATELLLKREGERISVEPAPETELGGNPDADSDLDLEGPTDPVDEDGVPPEE